MVEIELFWNLLLFASKGKVCKTLILQALSNFRQFVVEIRLRAW